MQTINIEKKINIRGISGISGNKNTKKNNLMINNPNNFKIYREQNNKEQKVIEVWSKQQLMDYYKDNNVLLIKPAWGGQSLYEHFRPPSPKTSVYFS